MNGWVVGPLLVLLLWVLVLSAFARPLRARWREPVFRHPLASEAEATTLLEELARGWVEPAARL